MITVGRLLFPPFSAVIINIIISKQRERFWVSVGSQNAQEERGLYNGLRCLGKMKNHIL